VREAGGIECRTPFGSFAFLRSEHLRWAQITREIGVLPE